MQSHKADRDHDGAPKGKPFKMIGSQLEIQLHLINSLETRQNTPDRNSKTKQQDNLSLHRQFTNNELSLR